MNDAHMVFCASEDWRTMVREQILPLALSDVDLGEEAIEVGPGPGFTTDVLRTHTARLTAVEIDGPLAASLTARLAGGNVDVVHGDATALDFEDDRFTGAASFHMLHHVAPSDRQDRVFAELARVLVPGGVLVAADGVYDEGSAAFHAGDTYNPIEVDQLPGRLAAVGFGAIEVQVHELGWVCTARAPAA